MSYTIVEMRLPWLLYLLTATAWAANNENKMASLSNALYVYSPYLQDRQ